MEGFIKLGNIRGKKGDTGTGLTVRDFYSTLEELHEAVPNPSVGDAYGVGEEGAYEIYIYSASQRWVNSGAFQPDVNDQAPTYAEATTLETLTSGEKISIAFGKIKKAIKELISHIGNKNNPHGTTAKQVGAISTTIYLTRPDILNITEDGLYYGVEVVNSPTSGTAGYIRVSSMCDNTNYRVVCWRPHNSLKEYVNVLNDGTWLGWTETFTNKGGVFTDDIGIKGGYGRFIADNSHATIRACDNANDTSNCMGLVLLNKESRKNSPASALSLREYINGEYNQFSIYGEHNKPSSTYRGNGSAEGITVNIGGVGKALLLYGTGNLDDSPFIVTRSGAFGKGGSTPLAFSRDVINFSGGVLTIKTNSPYFNADSSYTYQVL